MESPINFNTLLPHQCSAYYNEDNPQEWSCWDNQTDTMISPWFLLGENGEITILRIYKNQIIYRLKRQFATEEDVDARYGFYRFPDGLQTPIQYQSTRKGRYRGPTPFLWVQKTTQQFETILDSLTWTGGWGLVDAMDFSEILPCIYEGSGGFIDEGLEFLSKSDHLLLTKLNGLFGLWDAISRTHFLECQYKHIFSNGLTIYANRFDDATQSMLCECFTMDKKAIKTFSFEVESVFKDEDESSCEQFLLIKQNDNYGKADLTGHILIAPSVQDSSMIVYPSLHTKQNPEDLSHYQLNPSTISSFLFAKLTVKTLPKKTLAQLTSATEANGTGGFCIKLRGPISGYLDGCFALLSDGGKGILLELRDSEQEQSWLILQNSWQRFQAGSVFMVQANDGTLTPMSPQMQQANMLLVSVLSQLKFVLVTNKLGSSLLNAFESIKDASKK